MANVEKIYTDIDKQIEAGFSGAEIKQNLLSLNYTAAEIEQAFRQRKLNGSQQPKASGKTGIVSILISVYFIFRGIMWISSSRGGILMTWGWIMLLLGIAGVIWKTIDMARR